MTSSSGSCRRRVVPLLLALLICTAASHHLVSSQILDGLLPNGDFEQGPKRWEMKGTVVTGKGAIPNWETSGLVEYIKSGQRQGDMLLVVPNGAFAVRLGTDASIKTASLRVRKGKFYALTFNVARTCAQEEMLNVSVSPHGGAAAGILPMQTMYSCNGWDAFAWGFKALADQVVVTFHNPAVDEEDPACGPLLDSVALKLLSHATRPKGNMLKNGDFEEGPYFIPNISTGVLIPSHMEDDHSPLVGWIVESLKAVKYVDAAHFKVPKAQRAVELLAGRESAVSQVVRTTPGKTYVLRFAVGDAGDQCVGALAVEAYAGDNKVQVTYQSQGKGGSQPGVLQFKAVKRRTRITFMSSYYTMKNDHTGALCGPLLDDVTLVSARYPRKFM
ncbi:unnamed protein product [Linum tenue]|uniref:DUF642 domain-containing protein n=1 Tax=Linum tenue TaxID=586396 RepID=A0AAV0PTS0_9ROSI|nr:unnamed protein product [Linum tenue]